MNRIMPYGRIYKIPFENGKVYIGLTKKTLKARRSHHKKCAMNANETRVLYNALRKHNMIDTFELIEIDTAETMEELCEKEIEYIKKYDSYYLNKRGYNMTFGGEGTNGYEWTEEVRQKMSKAQKKHYENPEAIQKRSDAMKKYYEDNPEARQKNSEAKKKYYEDNPEAGRLHSEKMKKHYDNPEARQKCSDAQKKRFENPEARQKNSEAKKKYYEDNPEAGRLHSEKMKKHYDNSEARQKCSDAQKKRFENPEARQEMSDAMKKYYEDNPEARQKNSEAKKKYYEDNPEARQEVSERMKKIKKKYYENPEARQKMSVYKPFDVFKKDGTYVKSFDYQFEAKQYLQETYGIKNTHISKVLNGKQNSSQGFTFRYQVKFCV